MESAAKRHRSQKFDYNDPLGHSDEIRQSSSLVESPPAMRMSRNVSNDRTRPNDIKESPLDNRYLNSFTAEKTNQCELGQARDFETVEEGIPAEENLARPQACSSRHKVLVGLIVFCLLGLVVGLTLVLIQQTRSQEVSGVEQINVNNVDFPVTTPSPDNRAQIPSPGPFGGDVFVPTPTSVPNDSIPEDDLTTIFVPTGSPSTLIPVMNPTSTLMPTIIPSSKPSSSPTEVVSARYKQIKSRVVIISGAESLKQDVDTPQLKALKWLVDEDPSRFSPFDENLQVRYALTVLYHSTQGDGWKTNTDWNSAPDCCDWFGVTCESVNDLGLQRQAITKLNLSKNNLVGNIPKEIFGTLRYLKVLNLSMNTITGTIPETIGLGETIQVLELYNNKISGTIPASIRDMKELEKIYLDANKLSGTIPPQIGNLVLLQDVQFYNNSLDGALPSEFGLLKNVWRLYLNDNKISGELPPEIGNMQNLKALYLDNNDLYGEIPAALSNANLLEDLRLDNNTFYGELPNELGSLENLNILYLSKNYFGDPFPAWLGSLTKLEHLDLSGNLFGGNLPNKFPNLQLLDLSENKFEGSIPNELWESQNRLVALFLQGNELIGSIPSGLQNLQSLKALHLYGNNLDVESSLCSWRLSDFLVECNIGCDCCDSICIDSGE